MQGYLLIADISGYTFFLTHSELEHAQDIINTLMNILTDQMNQEVEISKLEGDAILAYVLAEKIQFGQTLLDWVESLYCTFRKTARTSI